MTSNATIDDFLSQHTLAVAGVSRGGKKFGNVVFRDLKAKGYRMIPVNPHAHTVEGERCYPDLGAIPEPVDGVVLVVPPQQTEQIVQDAARAGIRRVWMQPGAESAAAIRFCETHDIRVVHGRCIMVLA